MNKITFLIFIFFIFISIFIFENRTFMKQYFQNNTALEKYNSEDFQAAEKIFSWALSKNPDEIIAFNLGNTFLKQALEEKSLEKKISLLNKSIETYKQAQEIKNKNFIENNLEIATKLLENYKQKKKSWENNQQNNQDENQNNSQENTWENNDTQEQNWDTQENSQEQDEENQQNTQTSPWKNGDTSEQFNQLSNEQTQEIENYLEELKQIEKNNQQFFNKQPNNENFFEKFSNDPFLQNEFNRWWEKDW